MSIITDRIITSLKKYQKSKILILLVIMLLIPLTGKIYLNTILITIGFYSMIAMGFILLMGFAGQVSLGQAIFFGIGAYTSAVISIRFGLSPWITIGIAAAVAGAVAFILGRVIFRLRGLIVGGITLALNLIFHSLVESMSEVTGGATGMMNIPQLPSGGFVSYTLFMYYVVWGLVVILLIFSLNLVLTRTGRALKAMNLFSGGSDVTAQVLGVNILKYKAGIFALSAIYASIAGSLYAHYTSCIEPATFGVNLSVMIAIMAILGGISSPWGAILGTSLLVGFVELMRDIIPMFTGGITGAFELIAYGIILIAILRFLPNGIVSVVNRLVGSGNNNSEDTALNTNTNTS